jgi:molecular chaperone HtpG
MDFEEKPLVSVARGDLELGGDDETRAEQERATGEHKELLEKLKSALEARVKDVRISTRLTDSPSCLVADEQDMGSNLARILKAAGQKVGDFKPILEVNAGHPIVKRLAPGDERLRDWANLLFEQALLAEGGQLEDPAEFVKRSNDLMLSLSR